MPFSHFKEPGLFEEMSDFTSGTGNTQDKPGTSCQAKKQQSYQRPLD